MLALLSPPELAHAMAQFCNAQTIKAEEIYMKMQLDSSGRR
jgi:hypothetical protein